MLSQKPFIARNCQGATNSNILPIVAILVVLALIVFRKYNRPKMTGNEGVSALSICGNLDGRWDSSLQKCSLADNPEFMQMRRELETLKGSLQGTPSPPAPILAPLPKPPTPKPAPTSPTPKPAPTSPTPKPAPTPPPSRTGNKDKHCPNNYRRAQCKKVLWGAPCPDGAAQGTDKKQWYYATQEKIWSGKVWCYKCSHKAIPLFKPILAGSNCATLDELKNDKKDYKSYNKFIETYRVEMINSARPTELHES